MKVATKALGVRLKTFTVFGNAIEIPDEWWLVQGFFFALLYFLVMFLVYVAGDMIRALDAGDRAAARRPPPPRTTTRMGVMSARMMLDVLLPVVLGIVALVRWMR